MLPITGKRLPKKNTQLYTLLIVNYDHKGRACIHYLDDEWEDCGIDNALRGDKEFTIKQMGEYITYLIDCGLGHEEFESFDILIVPIDYDPKAGWYRSKAKWGSVGI